VSFITSVKRLQRKPPPILRRVALRLLRTLNVGDVAIRHHYTNERFILHSFRHRGYWYHGKRREEQTMAVFAALISEGDTVFDVGGHIGYISMYLATLVGAAGKVVVFEPGPNNLPYTRRNLSHLANVVLIESAVADRDGNVTLHTESLTGQNNSLLQHYQVFENNLRTAGVGRVNMERVEVPCTALDTLSANDPPSFVKIDVEGAECLVLQGMQRTLKGPQIALMVEVTENRREVHRLLVDAGFMLFDEARTPVLTYSALIGNIFCIKRTDPRIRVFAR
jgi:FkbM family methyltransferase